eukprot:4129288-Amphidinium_carterae.1
MSCAWPSRATMVSKPSATASIYLCFRKIDLKTYCDCSRFMQDGARLHLRPNPMGNRIMQLQRLQILARPSQLSSQHV